MEESVFTQSYSKIWDLLNHNAFRFHLFLFCFQVKHTHSSAVMNKLRTSSDFISSHACVIADIPISFYRSHSEGHFCPLRNSLARVRSTRKYVMKRWCNPVVLPLSRRPRGNSRRRRRRFNGIDALLYDCDPKQYQARFLWKIPRTLAVLFSLLRSRLPYGSQVPKRSVSFTKSHSPSFRVKHIFKKIHMHNHSFAIYIFSSCRFILWLACQFYFLFSWYAYYAVITAIT